MSTTVARRVDVRVYFDPQAGPMQSVYLVRPLTTEAKAWIKEHVDPQAQKLGDSVAVEHRYLGAIIEGMEADGLKVEALR